MVCYTTAVINYFPLSSQNVTRVLVVLVVILALAAGLFENAYTLQKKQYQSLEDKYVRVRSQLGREEMQKLIDQSYK